MRLKTSLNFRGYPNKNEIVYYDGEERIIEVNEFEKLWSLLKILENPIGDIREDIHEWKNKNGMDDEELQNIIQFINENRLLYEKRCDEDKEEQLFNRRNFNYFSTHDSTLHADTIVQKMKKIKAVVIGAGTIGATLCMTLSKLGVGEIIVIDFDTVHPKNIRAQTIFQTEDINKKKIHVIQEKLGKMDPYIKIQVFDMKIETLKDLLQLNLNEISYIFGCFDDSSLQLQKDIMDYCDEEKIKYFLMGYHNDFVKVLHVSNSNNGALILEDSFQNYYTEYVIRENRGTIIQSLAVSLIISRIIFGDIINDEHMQQNGYSFDFIKFRTSANHESIPWEPFTQSLQKIMPLHQEKLKRKIEEISNIAYVKGTILPKVIEIDILSMHQVFDILLHMDQLSILQLEEEYNEFVKLMHDIEEQDGNEEEYERYLQIIRNMKIVYQGETYAISEIFEMMRDAKDYEEKKSMQRSVYEVLQSNGDEILQFFTNSKKSYLSLETSDYYMEVFGVREGTLHTFEEKLQKRFHALITKSLSLIFPNSSGEISADFLAYNEEERSTILIDEAKEIILTSLEKYGQDRWINHIEKMFQYDFVQVYNEIEVNKTYYFPNTKESRILFNYHDDVDSLFILCHELGHAYFNQSYSHTFFDDSTQLVNEIMAYYFEIICVQAMFQNEDISLEIKREIASQYVKRIHQVVLSTYGVHLFETSLIKCIQDYGEVSVADFLRIREEYDQHPFFEGIQFKNEKYSYLNPLLKTSFIFEFGDHVLPPIAYLLAISLCHEQVESSIPKDIQIQEAILNGVYRTEEFLSYMSKGISHGERMDQAIDELLQMLLTLQSFMVEDVVHSR
ncbi:thiamine biosynthesis protein ThiF [Bacillus pseudomycoides]|uniref:Thiamine biosynthesis protein ThiF n=1 Tax=Bacillus pseudomycoides TaxID=64104 RepID=A0AA91ZSC2_9BACI|nr:MULTISPECIES: ThiF family adenylyltransferase [Bacillus]PEB53827.1 thiamine biosynthesis protein ThiF [Bacillus sp. AFS098217]PED81354.1 thiamine biosynthesis protein ThiF [Bacillus pseudomycoides]PEU10035.1 thiamine biosynthesis protein ThiF [Bacillus sp. AFS019443]PEU13625.1 thiamine biosynthesis protein ThiF [Bacillus sp. AFS014408]PFW64108.1 thiamine biosynthesis protein ThiF [Bacillus sp. AFS075034]